MKKTVMIIIVGLILSSIFNIIIPIKICTANGDTIYVDDSGGADYTNIQDAINAANESDIIYVYSGTYNENIVIDKTITLTGSGSSTTKIEGAGVHTIQITADNVEISGFTVENDESSFICIKLDHVENCEINNNIIKNGGNGIQLIASENNNIIDNTIEENNIGIYLSYSSTRNKIKNNQIQNNDNYGIQLVFNTSFNFIYLNHFQNNGLNNARDLSSTNYWDLNESEGNFWDDYNDYDSNGDGIGDNPYIIDSNSQDNYPLGVFINQKPVATISSITPSPANQGQTVYFYGDWSDDGSIIQWEWKSNINGIFGYSKNTQSSSLSTGTHTISFRIQDNDGEWSSYDTETLTIQSPSTPNQKPTAQIITISPKSANYGESIYFHGLGQDSDGTIKSYRWTSDIDGIISSESTFYTTDLSIGTHTITFKVEDNQGEWSAEKTDSVQITQDPTSQNQPPTANPGGPYSAYVNEAVIFDGSGSYDLDAEDTITTYIWEFGDGNTGEGKYTTHTYETMNNFIVYLTVTDNNGNQNTRSTYANVTFQQNNNSNGNGNGDNGDNDDKDKKDNGIPGFELFFVILALSIIIFFKIRKN